MKILVVDREELSTKFIAARLEPVGHTILHESSKNNAADRAAKEQVSLILLDPSPLTNARQLVLDVRRAVGGHPYVIIMSDEGSIEGAIKAGANDFLAKPIDQKALDEKVENASRTLKLTKRISDDSEDFPSAGGVIAKSAFNQLYLSAIERADRYGEQSFVLFITMTNYADIVAADGQYAADYAVALLSKYLVGLRRQSDIIGQTAKYEYALLLQRPLYETEPVEAANRFAEALSKANDIVSSGSTAPEITVSLIDLPVGALKVSHVVTGGAAAPKVVKA